MVLYVFLIIIAIFLGDFNAAYNKNKNSTTKPQRKKSLVSAVFSSNENVYVPNLSNCDWLNRFKHQNKLCRKRRGLSEVLLKARNLSVTFCEERFRYDQWNCSTKGIFFKKVYRETAFMYAITSSALTFAVARACSEGRLEGCKCAAHGRPPPTTTAWQWGGCGDNTRHARRFARKFLQLRKRTADRLDLVLRHNFERGIAAVVASEERVCRCHGVSGSCTVKICFKRAKPFQDISEQLKNLYHNALQVEETNRVQAELARARPKRRLLYLADSPNYCSSTVSRICRDADNCATLCCGRGFYSELNHVIEKCNCRWRNKETFDVFCDQCNRNETIFRCK